MKENIVKLTRVDDGNTIYVNLSNVTFVSSYNGFFTIYFIGTDKPLTVLEDPFPHLV